MLLFFNKIRGRTQSHLPPQQEQESPEERVARIQQGDLRLRNDFIADYSPYIAKVTSNFCKRFIDPSHDDEFSIALSGFNEAINQYSHTAGRSFLGFAETVIRRRLIDYVRKETRFAPQVPYSSFEYEDEDGLTGNPIEIYQAIEQYELEQLAEERGEEIAELSRTLQAYGITFSELVDCSPKHRDTRETMFRIGQILSDDLQLYSILTKKKTLPIKELMERVQVSRKTIERNRKYIIALALIYNGAYPHLRDYLRIPDTIQERSEET